jgi:hypothetical protein
VRADSTPLVGPPRWSRAEVHGAADDAAAQASTDNVAPSESPAANGTSADGPAAEKAGSPIEAKAPTKIDEAKGARPPPTPSTANGSASGQADEYVLIAPAPNQLFIKSVAPDISREALETVRWSCSDCYVEN